MNHSGKQMTKYILSSDYQLDWPLILRMLRVAHNYVLSLTGISFCFVNRELIARIMDSLIIHPKPLNLIVLKKQMDGGFDE